MSAKPTPPSNASPSPMSFDAESPPYVVIRWALYLGMMLIVGSLSFASVVIPVLRKESGEPEVALGAARDAARWGFHAALLVTIAALCRIIAQTVAFSDPSEGFDAGLVWVIVTQTRWGHGWLLQVAGVTAVLLGLHSARRSTSLTGGTAAGWGVAMVGTIALALSSALSGHAAASQQLAAPAVFSDTLHMLGAGAWLGGLAIVALVGIRSRPIARDGTFLPSHLLPALLKAFAPAALVGASVAGATGVFAAWLHVHDVRLLTTTSYGLRLLLKLLAVATVVVLGALNWRHFVPQAGHPGGLRKLHVSVSLELILGTLTLLITAVLVATATPDSLAAGS